MKNKLIFIELNEINFDLVKKYSLNYSFKVFNDNFFKKLKKTKSEDEYNLLEPWIQWVSIHTGLTAREHKIYRLGDFDGKKIPHIFKQIEDKGFEVGAICPMNVTNDLIRSKYFIPDPWIKNQQPKNFFYKKIYNALSEAVNKNSGSQISFQSKFFILLSFVVFMRKKFLFKLSFLVLKSLKNKWQKALIFDFLLNEIHIKLFKKYKIDFSTIFFNAGAHIQHHYLNNSNVINNTKNPEWYVKKSIDPILETYIFYDEIINEYLKMKNVSLLMATGLTQKPYDKSKFYYRLSNHQKFMEIIGIDYESIEPRMSRDFLVKFKNLDNSNALENKLLKINEINQNKFFDIDNRGNDVFVSLIYPKEIHKGFKLKVNDNLIIDFSEHVNFVAIKNGEHSPNGYLFSNGLIENLINTDNFHVKEIYNIINNYFKK